MDNRRLKMTGVEAMEAGVCHCLYLLSFWFKSARGLLNPDLWDT